MATFREDFGLHYGMQLVFSEAGRSGVSINAGLLARALFESYPNCGLSLDQIRIAICREAARAGIEVNTVSLKMARDTAAD